MFRHLYRHKCWNRIYFETCCKKMALVPGWALQIKILSTPSKRNVHFATQTKLMLNAFPTVSWHTSNWGKGPRPRKIHKQVMKQGRKYPNNLHSLTKELFASRLDVRVFHNATSWYKSYMQVHKLSICFMRDRRIVFVPCDVTLVLQEIEVGYHSISSSWLTVRT